ncbi:NADase-type glycan-binding domain-containing protein [Streptomyces sp. NPDC102406]|uniref:NADase-type glycan-binding domain-containing protein n=1 Tax=Streptomyces sp. NPDC102406 TaxID=3366171 RepID=UPI0038056F3B
MTSQAQPSVDGPHRCGECGNAADPDEPFCDACGAVLSWGRPARPASASATHRPSAAPPTGPGSTTPGSGRMPDDSSADASNRPTSATPTAAATAASAATGVSAASAASAATSAREAGRRTDARAAAETPQASDDAAAGEASPAAGVTTPGTAPRAEPDTVRTSRSRTDPEERDHANADAPMGPPASSASAPGTSAASAEARARNLIVPVPDRQPQPIAPEATPVLPGRPEAQVLQVRAPGRPDVVPDGIPCPWCATSNEPVRHFCDRCAMPMSRAADDSSAVPPWWRRLLDRRNRPAPWAGDRPRLRFGFDRVGNWLGAIVVLALIACAVMYTGPAIDAVRDHFVKRAPVAPDRVSASRSYAGHGAPVAFDRINNTWWGPGVSQSGDGDWLEAAFDRPTRLLDLVITPGVSAHGDQLGKSAQPHQVDAVITTSEGKKVTRRLTFDQGAGAQRRRFTVGEVTSVRLVVRSAYNTSDDRQLAIAEVEFFGASTGNSG